MNNSPYGASRRQVIVFFLCRSTVHTHTGTQKRKRTGFDNNAFLLPYFILHILFWPLNRTPLLLFRYKLKAHFYGRTHGWEFLNSKISKLSPSRIFKVSEARLILRLVVTLRGFIPENLAEKSQISSILWPSSTKWWTKIEDTFVGGSSDLGRSVTCKIFYNLRIYWW